MANRRTTASNSLKDFPGSLDSRRSESDYAYIVVRMFSLFEEANNVKISQRTRRSQRLGCSLLSALFATVGACAAPVADTDSSEASGDVSVAVSAGADGKLTVTTTALTLEESAAQHELWSAAAEYLNRLRTTEPAGSFPAWLQATQRTQVLATYNQALAAANEQKSPSPDGVGVESQALTYRSMNANTCIGYWSAGTLAVVIWTGANYTGSLACFTNDALGSHAQLGPAPYGIAGSMFYQNIRSLETYFSGIRTMDSPGNHYAYHGKCTPVPNADFDYMLDPFLHQG